MEKKNEKLMEDIVNICKRRGFIFPTSEIYGGFANSYSYGPYGTELKNNIRKMWWSKFVQERSNMVGMDGPILLNPKLWEASGHISGFNDAMVDCKACKKRYRADHLVMETTGKDLEGQLEAMSKILVDEKIKCPECKKSNWAEVRKVSQMFKTEMNGFEGDIYLRPETAGAIFMEFKNILDSMRVKIPFGIAQVGKAFRNEVVARNFIFRVREFEQMEIEYFIDPRDEWESIFDKWLSDQEDFILALGAKKEDIRKYEHPKEKLSHYSRKTVDIEYNFSFGWGEITGLAHRGDFDLTQHNEHSNVKQDYLDTVTNARYVPHVIEPTFGLDRTVLVALTAAYNEEKIEGDEMRTVLKFPFNLAPVKVAIFPLLKNKPDLVLKAQAVYDSLKKDYMCEFDDNGNIGKRYRRQDEIGTPYCITIDFDTLEDNTVTVRDRDSMKQIRINLDELKDYLAKNLK